MKALFLFAVIQNHIKTSRKGNNKLVQILVCVPAAFGSAGNIVKIVDAFDLKRHMSPAFNEGKIASWITDFWKVNNPAFG